MAELLLPDDLDEDRTVERELLRLLVDFMLDRFFEVLRTVDDLLTRVFMVFEIVFLTRLEIFEPRLRDSG